MFPRRSTNLVLLVSVHPTPDPIPFFQFQADELHLRACGELLQHPAAGHLRSRVPSDLAPAEQVVSRTPDPGAAPDLPQADQVSGHMSIEQH